MEMKLKTKYDEDADAAYIYVNKSGKVDTTVKLDGNIFVDLDINKKIVGIEILNAKCKLSLELFN